MINIEEDYIKKAKVKYLKCKQGGLHDGEIMNFICIDPNCKNKGLICPVCQSTDHQGHQTMHLKIFLAEIGKQLGTGTSGVGNISDYLRCLETSKKEMLDVLKDTVKQIAEKVKAVEQKIQDVYLSVRRSVLAQSALGTKLPTLYNLLTSQDITDEQQITEQIQKCSELLEYKNNKVYAIDSTQKLIDQFSAIPSSMTIHLSTMIPQITKLFDSLPIKVQKFGVKEEQAAKTSTEFSKTSKAASIKLSENSKVASIEGNDIGGIALVESNFGGKDKVKIAFKINQCLSDSISLGIGNPEVMKGKGFMMEESDNTGLFGICAMGIVLNDFQGQSFVFGSGDIIDVEWNLSEMVLTFSRRNGIEKYEVLPPITPEEAKKMVLFTSLLVPGDEVELVE